MNIINRKLKIPVKLNSLPFDKRKKVSEQIMFKYPDCIAVILNKGNSSAPDITKTKFIVPLTTTVGSFLYDLRKFYDISMSSVNHIFYFLEDGSMVPISETISEVYNKKKSDDGFLYFYYAFENTFG